ncbi:HNH endonuclease [Sulfurospirillum multivorans]|uniref:HNH endonuclease domain-containing protein n=2 Tax=Sulfurospirillum multivorans TaxID=66821 RepID=A0AA86AIV6_SULMK|nr:HNH endonuclease [Sulfurospirillum multivorans]AHJ11349.1 HNH endonuclease domain-containing protein [Sulfurospirillum multivorans DSM 12446]QEH04853.1 HNH endonuclease domain-containing protein [Sulfurospirillum multivorans]
MQKDLEIKKIKCLYCNIAKDEDSFSLEHIFPVALGGKVITDSLFKTRQVCKDCNSKLGLDVDGIFLKNFFIKKNASMDFLNYINFEDDKYVIPFMYMGKNEQVNHPIYKDCDSWLWQGGSRVYHFHNNYSDRFNAYAGGNPIGHNDKKRAGEAYLVSSTDNSQWIKKLLVSYREYFKNAKRYSTNINIQNENNFLNSPSSNEQNIINEITKISEENRLQINQLVFQIGFEIRFLSKIALAIGHNLFGEEYSNSNYAQILREVIWESDYQKLQNYEHKISNFFSESNTLLKDVSQIIAWKGGTTIILLPINNSLVLLLYLVGNKQPIVITITDELDCFAVETLNKFPNGCVWILIPQRQVFKGAYGLPEYLAYKTEDKSFINDLNEIEKLYVEFEKLPPFVIENKL